MCLNKRRELENANNNFNTHVHKDHDVVRYIEYFLFLKAKNPSNYNGIEYYVSKCIEEKNISFLPGKNTRFLISKTGKSYGESSQDKNELMLEKMVRFRF